ncbi:hypothetical protein [Anaerotignum sp.]
MKNRNGKHFLLLIVIFIAAMSATQYIIHRTNAEKKNMVAVVLPRTEAKGRSGVMDGIRDYAMNHDIVLDVWYRESLSSEELKELVSAEVKNRAIGILLVSPEAYMTPDAEEVYDYGNVLAITDTMEEQFLYTATFEGNGEWVYTLPVSAAVVQRLTEEQDAYIYLKNTYEQGYRSMEMVQQYDRTGSLSDICMEYQKVDGATIANGEIDALLVE